MTFNDVREMFENGRFDFKESRHPLGLNSKEEEDIFKNDITKAIKIIHDSL